MISASTPPRISFLAKTTVGQKLRTLTPESFRRCTTAVGGWPPASTTWLTRRSMQASASAISCGCMTMRLTPNGLRVSSDVASISRDSRSGGIEPDAMTPKPPPLEIAATRLRSETQVMAPPMMARRTPRNSRPRRQRRLSRALGWFMPSGCVEAVGRMQRANRKLGVFLGDENAHLDLRGGDHLDVDAFLGKRL